MKYISVILFSFMTLIAVPIFGADEAHIKRLLETYECVKCDLEGANLKFVDLVGANLEGANLKDADLRGANLNFVDLEGANLTRANLKDANLMGATLVRVNLSGANLEGASTGMANIFGYILCNTVMRNGDVSYVGCKDEWTLPPCPSDQSKGYNNCFATYVLDDGTKYVGEWRNDKRNGQGTNTYADGDKYVGEYKNHKMHGQGTYTFANGAKWDGAWENDNLNGYAITYYSNGSINQEGIFKNNKFLYAQKRTSSSSALRACPPPIGKIGNIKITDPLKHDCFGIHIYANGNTYEGGWQWGEFHGQGTYTYADGENYAGEYKDNNRHGHGTYTHASGDKYVGEYKDNNRHGQGTYTNADGNKYVGEFKDDNRNGYAITYYADGSINQEGIFKDDKFLYAQKKSKSFMELKTLDQIMQVRRPEWTKKQIKCFAKEMKKGLDKNLFDEFVSMMKKEKVSIDDVGVLMAVMPVSIGVAAKCGIPMDLEKMLGSE